MKTKILSFLMILLVSFTYGQKKISELPELVTPNGSDVLPIVNSGETKRISVNNLLNSSTSFNEVELIGNYLYLISANDTSIVDFTNVSSANDCQLDTIVHLDTIDLFGGVPIFYEAYGCIDSSIIEGYILMSGKSDITYTTNLYGAFDGNPNIIDTIIIPENIAKTEFLAISLDLDSAFLNDKPVTFGYRTFIDGNGDPSIMLSSKNIELGSVNADGVIKINDVIKTDSNGINIGTAYLGNTISDFTEASDTAISFLMVDRMSGSDYNKVLDLSLQEFISLMPPPSPTQNIYNSNGSLTNGARTFDGNGNSMFFNDFGLIYFNIDQANLPSFSDIKRDGSTSDFGLKLSNPIGLSKSIFQVNDGDTISLEEGNIIVLESPDSNAITVYVAGYSVSTGLNVSDFTSNFTTIINKGYPHYGSVTYPIQVSNISLEFIGIVSNKTTFTLDSANRYVDLVNYQSNGWIIKN